MKNLIKICFVVAALSVASYAAAVKDALFANVTTNEAHRANMAIKMPLMMKKMGHPVTIYLNDKGVYLASKDANQELPEAQKHLSELIKLGGKVLVCPFCLKHYNIDPKNLIDGVEISDPKKVEAALFGKNVQTISW
jgi:predicted peroxiredoxin